MSVMLRTGAVLVLKEKLLTSYLMPERSFIIPDLLIFHILETIPSEDIELNRSNLKYNLV